MMVDSNQIISFLVLAIGAASSVVAAPTAKATMEATAATANVLPPQLGRHLQQQDEEQARTACDAKFNSPCSRVTSRFLAKNTAEVIVDQVSAQNTQGILQDITAGRFNLESNFYPFVFDVQTRVCVAHGENRDWVGKTIDEIFQIMGIGFSLPDELHERFVEASVGGASNVNATGAMTNNRSTNDDHWVQYIWRDFLTKEQQAQQTIGIDYTAIPIKNKIAFVTSATSQYYVGVGYNHEQLPWNLPCSDKFDSWCSVNNIQSLVGKAESRITEAANPKRFT